MSLQDEPNSTVLDLEKELSHYWFCPNDRNMLQIHYTKQSQNPYFVIDRKNIAIGIQNAIAMRKITPEAEEQTLELVNFIFEKDPAKEIIDLVGVYCNSCGKIYSAPKLSKIEDGDYSKDRARAIFESTRALETKNFGPFRVVDHFGIARYARGDQGSTRTGFFWLWILGIRTILMMILLYYILGLEVKIGKRWLPIGPVMFIGGLIALIFIGFYYDIFGAIGDMFGGIY
ncbi:MAG: hypothetical protein ACFFB5_17765 [Promethearchaeota archaeon]